MSKENELSIAELVAMHDKLDAAYYVGHTEELADAYKEAAAFLKLIIKLRAAEL